MTEKRYVLFNRKDTDYILDNPNTSLDFIEMLGDALSSEEIVDRLNEQDAEIKNLKKALWESKKSYIEETNQFSIDIERDMEFLKEEFEREYWND